MPQYKLTYYSSRGLAEPIRLLFAYAGVPYEDNRIVPDATNYPSLPPEMKNKLPFGKVPVLEVDGKMLSQSSAILRYLAKQFKLTGKDDFEAAKCDELIAALDDFLKEFGAFHRETDPERKAALQKNVMEKTVPTWMSKLESILKGNGGKYYVGSGVTWVDFSIGYFMQYGEEKFGLPLGPFPAIKSAYEGIFALPGVKEWIAKRPADITLASN